ncbi:MAG: hypothetical protein HY782_10105 [Chloroflexi bacterium]|nr:hypothetical protein [Chloroflexota bacterium]
MQDRSYAMAIVVVLAICCLGMYVAVSGYLNSNPSGFASLSATPAIPGTLVVVVINTDTPAPTKPGATVPPVATSPPIPSPLGAFQTITAATTATVARTTATATLRAPLPPTAPPPVVAPSPAAQSCSNFTFCPSGGPPDAQLAPTGDPCPRNYIWGRIVDVSGKGLPETQIRFRTPLGNVDRAASKGPPDPPGIYNILAPAPGGSWTLWLVDSVGAQISPQITIVAPQPYLGSGNCPTRIDFKAQR